MTMVGLDLPLWMQNAAYPAAMDRDLLDALWQGAGTVLVGDLAVGPRGAGANMSVDVQAGRCIVLGSDTTGQGKYLCRSTSTNNLTIAAAPGPGTSRIDRIVAHVYDSAIIGGSLNLWQLEVVQGAAAATPVAPTVPPSAFLLADVTVPNGLASVVAGNITDRRTNAIAYGRPWDTAWGKVAAVPNVTVQQGWTVGTGPLDITAFSLSVPMIAGRRYATSFAVEIAGGTATQDQWILADASSTQLTRFVMGAGGIFTATGLYVEDCTTTGTVTRKLRVSSPASGSSGTRVTATVPGQMECRDDGPTTPV